MSFRRTVLACAVTFVGALAVFTLPRFAWNSLQGAIRPPAAPDAVLPPPAIAPLVAQAAPRSAGQRLTGLFGIVLILGIGMALSRNRDRKSTRLNSSHDQISYAVFCLKKKNNSIMVHNDCAIGEMTSQCIADTGGKAVESMQRFFSRMPKTDWSQFQYFQDLMVKLKTD